MILTPPLKLIGTEKIREYMISLAFTFKDDNCRDEITKLKRIALDRKVAKKDRLSALLVITLSSIETLTHKEIFENYKYSLRKTEYLKLFDIIIANHNEMYDMITQDYHFYSK